MEIIKIPITQVYPSPMNPRKTFNEEDIKELADNIESQGLLQPITVRQKPGTGPLIEYELICGERRFRAYKMLSEKWSAMDSVAPKGYTYDRFDEITAIVREMNDDEAFEAMITENLQRKDVDPIEEAFAFGQLIEKGKTVEEVAARFGKSVRFVQDRVKLNNLVPELMLALKDEKMSISAAMMIAKLGEDDQRKFHSQYQHNARGYTKDSAERFIDDLFLNIDKSLWYQSDNQADENFAGGCGCSCSECKNNTSNHGCLFWEMKSQDSGRCTDRAMFYSKTVAFMLAEIDKIDNLVKKDEPLEHGKTVIIMQNESYEAEEVKILKRKIRGYIEQRGLEIVDNSFFRGKCYYDNNDERVSEMLKKGEIYRCLELFDWRHPTLKFSYWYLKKDDVTTNCDVDGKPHQVKTILTELDYEEKNLKYSYITAEAETLSKCIPSTEPLTEDERVLLLCCMLTNNHSLAENIGMVTSQSTNPDNLHQYVVDHPEKWAVIMSGWMLQQINGSHPNLRIAEPMLDSLGKKHCPVEYQKAKDKVLSKFNKSKSKAERKLKELGYGLDGKPLKKTENIELPECTDIQKQFKEMKKKHPDALILFRVGDFYECFHEDAEKAGEVLKLTVTMSKDRKLAGFPEHALETYVPKLTRAGVRVAICEKLENPKTKEKK